MRHDHAPATGETPAPSEPQDHGAGTPLIGAALIGFAIILLGTIGMADEVDGFESTNLGPYLPAWVGMVGLVLAAISLAYGLALVITHIRAGDS